MRFLPKKWIIRCLLYYYQLTKKETLNVWFRPKKIPALSRNGPQVVVFVLSKRWTKMPSIAQLAEQVLKYKIHKQTNGKQALGWDSVRPNMLEEERVAMCANQEARRKMHCQLLVSIFWECTTLLSSEEASLCHKEAGTHFDKRTVLTMFRALTKVNN